MASLLDENSNLINRDLDKVEMFNDFFTFVFNTDDGLWHFRWPELEDCDWGNNQFPDNTELAWDLLLHMHAYKSMGFIQ